MIKITRLPGDHETPTRLHVEGRIHHKTTDELTRACGAGLAEGRPLLLDLSGVSFVDADGAHVVATLVERGATVVGSSPFVNEILRTYAPGQRTRDAVPDDDDLDGALLDRLRRGDDSAFEEMTRRYAGRMLAVARRMLRNEEEARDAVQEAFTSAFKACERFHGDAKVSTWLHRIVVNAALMRLRSRRRKPESSLEELLPSFDETGHWASDVEPIDTPSDAYERHEIRAAVRKCIDLLPEAYRTVLLLRDIEELGGEETAAELGMTVSAVKSRLHRARHALRTLLARELAETRASAAGQTRAARS
ncbi:MAG: sigma-70 family RNA polymerase sigma factor [Deltaproteobacteria bacterium]|nr:sigma-70 family RNA polymerase sigma factor [Deltaproteobacteria bacterium]